jgi:heme-degrading monooxygenase HmoA
MFQEERSHAHLYLPRKIHDRRRQRHAGEAGKPREAISLRGDVKGLKNQWFARDRADPDAGYSISLWDNEADMKAFWDSKKREEAMALLRPYFLNQFTVTQCEVRFSQPE